MIIPTPWPPAAQAAIRPNCPSSLIILKKIKFQNISGFNGKTLRLLNIEDFVNDITQHNFILISKEKVD